MNVELIVEKQELGILTTNAERLRDKVKKEVKKYKIENYNEKNIDEAKVDKALLNKSAKMLNEKRIELEKEFMLPFNEFKEIINETCEIIKNTSTGIDNIVKEVEQSAKLERNTKIKTIFDKEVQDLKDIITLEMVKDEKWLNKGSFNDKGDFKKENELIDKLNTIRKELLAISELKSKYEVTLKNIYLSTFDLGQVILKNNELIQSEELLATQEVQSYEKVEELKDAKQKELSTKKVLNIENQMQEVTLTIKATISQLKTLKDFFETNNIEYTKVNIPQIKE